MKYEDDGTWCLLLVDLEEVRVFDLSFVFCCCLRRSLSLEDINRENHSFKRSQLSFLQLTGDHKNTRVMQCISHDRPLYWTHTMPPSASDDGRWHKITFIDSQGEGSCSVTVPRCLYLLDVSWWVCHSLPLPPDLKNIYTCAWENMSTKNIFCTLEEFSKFLTFCLE